MSAPPAAPWPTPSARIALLRAELERLGLSGARAERECARLAGTGGATAAGWEQGAASVATSRDGPDRAGDRGKPTEPRVPRLGSTPPLRWGDRELPLGTRTLIVGAINVTDDSFSGDGLGRDLGAVLARAEELVAAGADVLDVGGESTRPGARAVPVAEERARVEPAVAHLARRLAVPISVDTRKAAVAEAALAAGAVAVNDVSGLRHDRALAALAAQTGAGLILGHWEAGGRGARHPGGGPRPWGEAAEVVSRVLAGLAQSVAWALVAGCAPAQLAVDPGLGFGKPPRASLALLDGLDELRTLGLPVVVGPSRKGFIGAVLGAGEQLGWEGTAAAVALAIAGGADLVRVHDVARLSRVVRMADAIVRAI